MKFRFVAAQRAPHKVSRLCEVVGVARQGFYAWQKRAASPRRVEDERLKALITSSYEASRESYGAPRIWEDLFEAGERVGRKRVARLMQELGIQGVSRRRRLTRTTVKAEEAKAAPDLVKRRFRADRPDQVWAADITYIPTHEGWLFLAVVIDVCSRKVVGWSMRQDLDAAIVVDAVSMAVTRRRPPAGVVHHSDRGSQYTSLALGKTLRDSGIVASMGSRGDAYDNALAESFMSTIKLELINRQTWTSRDQARLQVFSYIESFYNPLRRHSSLGMRSPDEYEKLQKTNPTAATAA